MRQLIFLFLIFIFSCRQKSESNDRVIFDRIEYIYNLKSLVDSSIWKDFSNKKFDLPLVYYTDTVCYIANPTEKFITIYNPDLVFENQEITIYKTPLLDSVPFHMETGIILGDSTSDYNYRAPFMNSSSFEITRNTIPGVNSTETWASMVIHEYFHGFQFKHSDYINHFEKNGVDIPADSLKKIYKNNEWFKERVDMENDILLSALNSNDNKEIKALVDSFFQVREQRRLLTQQRLNFNITKSEQTYETMEGTARYVEYKLYGMFENKQPDHKLIKSDTAYQSYNYYRNYGIEKDPWLYQTRKTTYFYATGFNIARLLDKLEIEYKSRLFNEGELAIDQVVNTD
jgi:hypothetical protein